MSQSFTSPAFAQFVAQLSPEQQQRFFSLVKRLQAVGDSAKLEESDRQQLLEFAQAFSGEHPLSESKSNNDIDPPIVEKSAPPLSTQFIRTPFVALVRETLNAELCAHGGHLSDAITYTFHNKWLPEKWKDTEFCEQLFAKYKMEIESHNAWRASIESVHKLNEDKKLAVGLAWFNTIYRLQQLLDAGLDLDQS